jgi:hypothetical protein
MRRRRKCWRGICGWGRKNEKETILIERKAVDYQLSRTLNKEYLFKVN